MSPTIARIGSFRFFFNSREEKRAHVHIASSKGIAKFWLDPIIALAAYYNVSKRELRKIEMMVRNHETEFKTAWHKHFGQ
jgi:hypothetical protein